MESRLDKDNLMVCLIAVEKFYKRTELPVYIKGLVFLFWVYSPIVLSISGNFDTYVEAMMQERALFGEVLNNRKRHHFWQDFYSHKLLLLPLKRSPTP